jgi:hypothetical protein
VRVLNLSLGADTGGQQYRTWQAFKRHAPTIEYESVVSTRTFYEIPRKYNKHEVRSHLWPRADVVHLHNDVTRALMFHRTKPKPLVIHHHGTIYRIGYEKHLADAARLGAVPIVSTLDLQAIAPDRTTWLPAPYNLDELASYRGPKRDDGVLRIAHAPTNRLVKSTALLIETVDRLRDEGAAVELDIIEKVSNAECIRRKGLADLYVDQLLLGYGCNSIEAWGMGLPVIAGIDPEQARARIRQKVPDAARDLMLETWGALPFYEASEATLYDALRAMLDPGVRSAWADVGIAHVRRWHDDAVTVAKLREIYVKALT